MGLEVCDKPLLCVFSFSSRVFFNEIWFVPLHWIDYCYPRIEMFLQQFIYILCFCYIWIFWIFFGLVSIGPSKSPITIIWIETISSICAYATCTHIGFPFTMLVKEIWFLLLLCIERDSSSQVGLEKKAQIMKWDPSISFSGAMPTSMCVCGVGWTLSKWPLNLKWEFWLNPTKGTTRLFPFPLFCFPFPVFFAMIEEGTL